MLRNRLYIAVAAALGLQVVMSALSSHDARADERTGCQGFSWPLEVELGLMSASSAAVENDAEVAPPSDQAVQMSLTPAASTTLPFKPGVKARAIPQGSFSGWIRIANVPAAGTYQITISHDGWIDAAQGGELLESTGFTGSRGCKILHKSVRYALDPGPLTIQLSGVPVDKVKLTLRRAD